MKEGAVTPGALGHEQICEGHWRGAASGCTAHWGWGNAAPTATARPSPEPCEHSVSPWFGKRNAVVKAQLSHNLQPAGAKNIDFEGAFGACSELRNLPFSCTSRTGFEAAPDGSSGCGTPQLSLSQRRTRPGRGGRPDKRGRPGLPQLLPPRGAALGGRRRRCRLPGPERGSAVPLSLPPSLLPPPSTPLAPGFLPRRRPGHAGRAGEARRGYGPAEGAGLPQRRQPRAPARVPAHGAPPAAAPSPRVCGPARAEGLLPRRTGVTAALSGSGDKSRLWNLCLKLLWLCDIKGLWPRLPNPFERQHWWVFLCLCDFLLWVLAPCNYCALLRLFCLVSRQELPSVEFSYPNNFSCFLSHMGLPFVGSACSYIALCWDTAHLLLVQWVTRLAWSFSTGFLSALLKVGTGNYLSCKLNF